MLIRMWLVLACLESRYRYDKILETAVVCMYFVSVMAWANTVLKHVYSKYVSNVSNERASKDLYSCT